MKKIKFSVILKTLIRLYHLTQKKLGEELNIPEYKMSDYCRGEQEPNIEDLLKFADFFSLSLESLLGEDKYFSEFILEKNMLRDVIVLPLSVLDQLITRKEVFIYQDYSFHEVINIDIINKKVELKDKMLKFRDYGKIWTITE